METLWKSEVFTSDDFRVFKYQPDPEDGVSNNVPECQSFHTNTTLLKEHSPEKWLPAARKRKTSELDEWLKTASPTTKAEEYFALLLPPLPPPKRPTRVQHLVNAAGLKRLPISQASFTSVVEKLSIHHAFAVIVDRGVPMVSRIKSEINGKNCYVYTLRVEHNSKDQSAMTITHFREALQTPLSSKTPNGPNANGAPPPQNPLTSETYAFILGYKDTDIASLKKCLQGCKESIFNPFTLIKAFLSIERGHRFTEVNRKIQSFQNILQNYRRIQFGSDGSGQLQDTAKGSEDEPKRLIDLYEEIYMLKIRLVAWSTQIAGLKEYTDDFLLRTPGQPDIDPEEYLQRMVDEYEVKISKCEMVLQGASLAFQMETAHLARLDSARSIKIAEYARADSVRSIQIAELSRLDSLNAMRDGKQMKAIALLTMIFFPGTFIATILAVPEFDSIKDTTRFKPWAWYPILFVPLTVVVLGVYFVWITYYKSESQKEVGKYKIYRPAGMEAVSLTTTGNV